MTKRPLYVVASVLVVVGLALFLHKVLVQGFPLVPRATAEAWELEIRVRFEPRDEPVRVTLRLPETAGPFGILDEHFVSQGYGLVTRRIDDDRQAVWSTRSASGEQTLYYRSLIQRFEDRPLPTPEVAPEVDAPDLDEPRMAAARALLDEVIARSADVDSLVPQLVRRLGRSGPNRNVALLLGDETSTRRRAEVTADILAVGGIPGRVIRGLRLEEEGRGVPLESWLQVWQGEGWSHFDPESGEAFLPEDFLVLVRGDHRLVGLRGGSGLDTRVSVRHSPQSGIRAAITRQRLNQPLLWDLSLYSLPLEIQEVYRVLLLLPVGAFLLVLMRTVVGVRTIGTFMPVLIGLAFRETRLLWGLVLFSSVLAFGLWGRILLERLKLLMVPRLAAVLFMVIFLMLAFSIVANRFNVGRALSVALFPMVILTITIERMSVVWEERGPAEAIQQGAGSLATATLAYLVMFHPWVEHWSFVFPELLLILLAAILLLGRYSGYRLTELRRFRALAGEEA